MRKSLNGTSVLVTRPEVQAISLGSRIEAEGGLPILAPMLAIRAASGRIQCARVDLIDEYVSVIFISPNAVKFGLGQIKQRRRKLTHQRLFAVGAGTAASLRECGYAHVSTPVDEFNSDGLLQLQGLQGNTVRGSKILIFRGLGGREHLAQTLSLRGAEVDYCEVYERYMPPISVAGRLAEAHVTVPDIGIVTSLESLNNLAAKIDAEQLHRLFNMPLVVVSRRIAHKVAELGFTNPPVMVDNPDNDTIINALNLWLTD